MHASSPTLRVIPWRGGVARWLHGELRLAAGARGDQPPLRLRRDPAQFDLAEQPDRNRLQCAHAGRSCPPARTRACMRSNRSRTSRRRCAPRSLPRRMRSGARVRWMPSRSSSSPPAKRRPATAAASTVSPAATRTGCSGTRDPRRAPGLRAAAQRRQLRRRGRQLDVAAPHRRLLVLSRLCRSRRPSGDVLARQRAVPSEAFPQARRQAPGRRRLRDVAGYPAVPAAMRSPANSTRPPLGRIPPLAVTTRTSWRWSTTRPPQSGHRGEVRRHRARLAEHAEEL